MKILKHPKNNNIYYVSRNGIIRCYRIYSNEEISIEIVDKIPVSVKVKVNSTEFKNLFGRFLDLK